MAKTTRDYIGEQYVLWAAIYSSAATQDGVGRIHDGYVVLDEFTVVVTEQHMLAGAQSGNGLALVAKTETGQKFRYEDGSWWREDEDRTPHADIVDALMVSGETHRYGMNTYVDNAGRPAIPSGTEFCLYHGKYYLPEDGCRSCAQDRTFQLGDEAEGPLYYVQCPFCEQMRSGAHEEDQHWHLSWAHAGELVRLGIERGERRKYRFSQFRTEAVAAT